MNTTMSRVLSATALVAGLACADATAPKPPSVVAKLALSPATIEMVAVGQRAPITPVALAEDQTQLELPTLTWTSSASAVATVDANGAVTAAGEGDAFIRASVSNTVKDSVAVHVRPTIVFAASIVGMQNGLTDSTAASATASLMVRAKP
jgi:uncharacterized protein YjdB